jgi:predicted nucleic acid-binding Zn ribbon protein
VSADPPHPRHPEPTDPATGDGHGGPPAGGPGAGTPADVTGPDLARAALDAARVASRRRGTEQAKRRVAGARRRRGGYSGPRPDDRDPQPFGRAIKRLVEDRDWSRTASAATVLAGWDRLVGPEIAARCQPVSLTEGVLTLAAESTAWAMELRRLAPKLIGKIRAEVGPDVVTQIRVHGPTTPTWGAGPRRVAGRGPRDTYG